MTTRAKFISTMVDYPWGGSEELWGGAARQLASRGHVVEVNVKNWRRKVPEIERLETAGCTLHRRTEDSRAVRLLERWAGINLSTRWLQSTRPNLVVIAQGGNSDGLSWAEHCLKAGFKYVLIVQASGGHLWPRPSLLSRLRAAYTGAERAYFVSNANLESVQTLLACDLPNGRVVWNPFKVNYDADLPFPSIGSSFRLACVARLDPSQKGQDLLLKVLAQEKWKQRNLSVSFVGDGPYYSELRALAAQRKLDNVRWLGQVDGIEKVWAEHHALVLPSRFEGMSLALIEALICSRPAIVTDVGGNAELVREGLNGFVSPAATVALIDQALERAWEHRTNWEKMGIKGAEAVRSRVPRDPCGVFAQELESLMV